MESTVRYTIGQKVSHAKFGYGVVIECEGVGDKKSVMVNFKNVGVKQLMLKYAQLEPIENTVSPQKKSPPHLKLVSNNPHIQTKNFTQNVEKIENQTLQLIEKQVNHYKGKDKPKADSIPRLLPEQGGLTDGHRATINKLIDKYALVLEIVMPRTTIQGRCVIANRAAKEAAISSGEDGCNSTVRILDVDFERVRKTLQGRIAGILKSPMAYEKRNDKLDYAHKRFKELGVSEETRRYYQLAKYGHDSTGRFSVAQLFDYCEYLRQPHPTFDTHDDYQDLERQITISPPTPQKPKLNTQQKRESILEQWLVDMEKLDPTFDRWLMTYSTDNFYLILKKINKLFVLSDDTLRKFMETQKICSLKTGRRPNE